MGVGLDWILDGQVDSVVSPAPKTDARMSHRGAGPGVPAATKSRPKARDPSRMDACLYIVEITGITRSH